MPFLKRCLIDNQIDLKITIFNWNWHSIKSTILTPKVKVISS